MNTKILLLSSFFILTACGGSVTKPDDVSQSDVKTEDITSHVASTIVISGNENFTFEQEAKFACVNNLVHVQTFTQSPKFNMYLPSNIAQGTYSVSDFDANSEVSFEQDGAIVAVSGNFVPGSGSGYGKFYFKNSSGKVIITKMPKQPGDVFEAKVDVQLESKDAKVVTVEAVFNTKSTGSYMMNCNLG